MMRQADAPPEQPAEQVSNMSARKLALHSIKEEDDARSSFAASNCSLTPKHTAQGTGHAGAFPVEQLTVLGEAPCMTAAAAAANAISQISSPRELSASTEDGTGDVDAVDIGLKVANEIMGLHSQAAAASRALEESNRQMEQLREENQQLKEDVMQAQQAYKSLDEEMTRLRAKVDFRGIELLLQEQKLQAAEECAEAAARKAAEQDAAVKVASERYDSLVMQLMVVVVKAAVAAEDLEKVLQQNLRDDTDNQHQVKLAIHHALGVLSSLAGFKEAWLAQGPRAHAAPQPTVDTSCSDMDNGADGFSTTTRSRSPKTAYPQNTAAREPSGRRCTDAMMGSSVLSNSFSMTLNSCGNVAARRRASIDSRALLNTADISPVQISAIQQQQLALEQHQQHLQQLQQKRQQRSRSASPGPGPRRNSRSRSVGGTPPNGRSPSQAGTVPTTATLSAAANLVYGSILQQKRQLRSLTASPGSRVTTPRRASTTRPQRPRHAGVSGSVAVPATPLTSRRVQEEQLRSQASPSRPAMGAAYDTPVSDLYNSMSPVSNGSTRAVSPTAYSPMPGAQSPSGQPLCLRRNSSSFTEYSTQKVSTFKRRATSSNGWY